MNDRALFGEMCEDAILQRVEAGLRNAPPAVPCSKTHLRAMRRILRQAGVRPEVRTSGRMLRPKYWILVAVLALLVLLTACAAYVFKYRLCSFRVMKYPDHLNIVMDESDKGCAPVAYIERNYELTYIPKGYYVEDECNTVLNIFCVLRNSRGGRIVYCQTTEYQQTLMDSENIQVLHHESIPYELLYINNQGLSYYVWHDEQHYNILSLNEQLPIDEILKIVCGIVDVK